jgi:lipoprotein-releasing system permease protein
MFKPLALFIGFRYVRAKRQNGFISFISLASFLGIALGVTVLITVLSVMNGFDQQIRHKIFSLADQVTVTNHTESIPQWQVLGESLKNNDQVVDIAPFVDGQAMLTHSGEMKPVIIKGIEPSKQALVANMNDKFIYGSFDSLKAGEYGVLIGAKLANMLDVTLGDKITMIGPKATSSPMGMMPRYKRLTITGIFHVGSGFGYDDSLAFMHLKDAQTMYQMSDNVSGIRLKIHDLYDAVPLTKSLRASLPPGYWASNWTDKYGQLFNAIAMEKTMMFLILFLIIAIAAFNLVSMLVMMVTDKQSEIAILRTQGASRGLIMAVFMFQGCLIGLVGTLIGVVGGVQLSAHVTGFVAWLEQLINHHFVMEGVYWIDYLPSRLLWSDVRLVGWLSLMMSLLATLYPAFRAAKVHPAKALRYE